MSHSRKKTEVKCIAEFKSTQEKSSIFICKLHKIEIKEGLIYKSGQYFNYYCNTKCFEDYDKFSLHPTKYKSFCANCYKKKTKVRLVKQIENYSELAFYEKNTDDYKKFMLSLKDMTHKRVVKKIYKGLAYTFNLSTINICQECIGDTPLNTTVSFGSKSYPQFYYIDKEDYVKFTCRGCKRSYIKEDILKVTKRGKGVSVCDETCANIYLLQKTL